VSEMLTLVPEGHDASSTAFIVIHIRERSQTGTIYSVSADWTDKRFAQGKGVRLRHSLLAKWTHTVMVSQEPRDKEEVCSIPFLISLRAHTTRPVSS